MQIWHVITGQTHTGKGGANRKLVMQNNTVIRTCMQRQELSGNMMLIGVRGCMVKRGLCRLYQAMERSIKGQYHFNVCMS